MNASAHVIENCVEERAVLRRQLVGQLYGLAVVWELCVRLEVATDVNAPTLDHVVGQVATTRLVCKVSGSETGVEQPDEVAEGGIVSAVGGCCHKNEVPAFVVGQSPHQLVTLGPAGAALAGVISGDSMGLIDDDEIGGSTQEVVPLRLGLNEVG